jgi:hypothetical protein
VPIEARGDDELGRAAENERRGRELLGDAETGYTSAAHAGSLDGRLALVRLAAERGDFERAQLELWEIERHHPDAPTARLVTVAPQVLAAREEPDELPGEGAFTIITRHVARAAQAIDAVADQLLEVDEYGRIGADESHPAGVDREDWDVPYTPNHVHPVQVCNHGVLVLLDTEGCMWTPMARTIVEILSRALIAAGVAAHITGHCPTLEGQWRTFTADPPRPG